MLPQNLDLLWNLFCIRFMRKLFRKTQRVLTTDINTWLNVFKVTVILSNAYLTFNFSAFWQIEVRMFHLKIQQKCSLRALT